MEEIWKDIEGYEGKYEVSNLGRVRSLDYTIMQPNAHDRHLQPITYKGKMIKPHEQNSGYLQIGLRDENGKRQFLVHRLVAVAFIPNPDNLPDINHKDENRHNNHADNLEWCTKKYNVNYGNARQHLSDTHRNHPNLSMPVEQLSKNGEVLKEYQSANEASRQTGISLSGITRCCNGEKHYKSAGGYRWRYKQ